MAPGDSHSPEDASGVEFWFLGVAASSSGLVLVSRAMSADEGEPVHGRRIGRTCQLQPSKGVGIWQ
jgi:hypothetical protein